MVTKEGDSEVIKGCCVTEAEHYCPERGCVPDNTDAEDVNCCDRTLAYYCWKTGTCLAKDDQVHDCCTTKKCPLIYGGFEYCLENHDNWVAGADCCSVIDETTRECATAHPDVHNGDHHHRGNFVGLSDLPVMGNCRTKTVEYFECCDEPQEYWCEKQHACKKIDDDCCIERCEGNFILSHTDFNSIT